MRNMFSSVRYGGNSLFGAVLGRKSQTDDDYMRSALLLEDFEGGAHAHDHDHDHIHEHHEGHKHSEKPSESD